MIDLYLSGNTVSSCDFTGAEEKSYADVFNLLLGKGFTVCKIYRFLKKVESTNRSYDIGEI